MSYKVAVWIMIVLLLASTPLFAQEPTSTPTPPPTEPLEPLEPLDGDAMETAFLNGFNRILREDIGTRALARNPILDEVAGEIAEAVGCTTDRIEFDIQHEVAERGFAAFPEDDRPRTTRVPLLPLVNYRPIEEMAEFYTADIFQNNINQAGRFYREIGIGISPCVVIDSDDRIGSTQQYGLFVILGAQPNVIPLVIENGTDTLTVSETPVTVQLSIHQENSRQREGIFGRADTMRLSPEPLTDNDDLMNYRPSLDWELTECGTNTIYYELIDTEGLTISGDTVVEVVCEE